MESATSSTDVSQLKSSLFKMRKDRRNVVQNSSECMRRAEEGKVVVLKGNPFLASLFLIIIVGTAVTISIVFSFDLRTVIILLASTLTMGLAAFFSARNKILILHPNGFLYRKLIFFTFCQKWRNLTSPPHFRTETDSEGGRYYNLLFTGMWGIKRFDTSTLKIKDIRDKNLKLQFLWELTSKFFENANLS
ncbi:MAG: hypothetical protein ACXABG_09130 [Promethearchaeota archaeon]|jgi:hypothetical protein